jgi:hypothetical protein
VVAPIAAFTMATLLFVYSSTSIKAAKLNAQRHREADGGQINWNNETRRRHGQLALPDKQTEEEKAEMRGETEQERTIRERKWRKST